MKEIKFRIWSKKREEYESNSNYYINGVGDVVFMRGDDYYDYVSNYNCKNSEKGHIIEFFIGLKDKNGKDIFEGDKVLVEGLPYIMDTIRDSKSLEKYCPDKVEVIGNIHNIDNKP